MPPVYRHGQSAAVLCDEKNLSDFLTSATITASMDPAEVTNFGSGCDREYVRGLRNTVISCDGLFAAATSLVGFSTNDIANFLDAHFAGSSDQVVTVAPEGLSTGRRAYLFSGIHTTYDISAPVSDMVSLSVDFQGTPASPGFAPGKILAYKTSTSPGSGAGVTFQGTTASGGSTGGGLAHLHVVSERNVTTATVKVQHSTSGSTWADLISFTATTGRTFQRSTVAGTIKERLRGTLSTLTEGATGGSLTWAVAFSRNGSPRM